MINTEQFNALTLIIPGASSMTDAGIDYIYLPALKVVTGEVQRIVDGMLCPMQHGGYATRLFLAEPVQGRGQNWTVHTILSRTWHTWSWNGVPANLSLTQILSAHLGALR